ncbi:hypothetical protein QNH07_gp06 [Aeromonas phage BUCT696]|uniref:hypothetical protein n=1 Tax=Aeromonas phage BUCT696 TaxID=2911664 RepID=UPI0024AD5542|nr:hypothetical protein QNH07_gp06 [Aeromonas phage BUCT696]UKH48771.1 hypothetical protein [Aeromonas phage BUCT696]
MNLDDLNTVPPLPYDWAKMDFTNLENQVKAMIEADPSKFTDEYLCTWKDERQFLVKRRYDLQPVNTGELTDYRGLIGMVQPITATGVNVLNSLRVNQRAHTNMHTITRVN